MERKDLVELDLKYFRAVGLWHPGIRVWICMALIFTTHVILQITDTLLGDYPFSLFTEKLAVNLTMLESAVKMGYYWKKRDTLRALARSLKAQLLKCSSHRPSRASDILQSSTKLANTVVRGFVTMILFTVGVWSSLPLLNCLFRSRCSHWQITPSHYPLASEGVALALVTYIWELWLMVFCATLLYSVNCLFLAIALVVCGQIDILNDALAAPFETECQIAIFSRLKDCIADHQTILKIVREMEEMFNPMFLFQMLISTVTICLVLVQLNEHSDQSEAMSFATTLKFFMYLVFGSMELLVYSWGGQLIHDQTGNVGRELEWAEGGPLFRRALATLMLRANRPSHLTAGKFYTVNLHSFAQVMKASYSYFTFLHGTQAKGIQKFKI